MNKVLFSSTSDNWATPQYLYDDLNNEFHFTLDPCADETNHKCDTYFTKEDNGLSKDWGGMWYSAILLTAERYTSGVRKPIRSLRSQILL